MKARANMLRAAAWLTQLGLSILMPPVLLMLLAVWLQGRFGLGDWVLAAAIAAGLLSSFCSMLSFYRAFVRRNKKKEQRPPAFNDHE